MSTIAAVIGRILLSLIFIISGISKLFDVAGTEAMLVSAGLAGGLAVAVGLFEIVTGLCLALGLMTRLVSLLLIGFTALTILFFHSRFTDPAQSTMALKNLAIMGGLFLVFAHSQIWYGWDAMRRRRREEIAHDAEVRAHEAEVRAARAEGRAEATGETVVVSDVDGDGIPETRKRRWL